jgi:protein SCO1/2
MLASMPPRFFLLLTAFLIASTTLTVTAHGKTFSAMGVVRAPLDDTGHITIAHDDIPGLMPAMTMSFAVANRADASPLTIGDRVRFELHTDGANWTVASFAVVGHVAMPAPAHSASEVGRRLREGDYLPAFSCLTEDQQPLTSDSLHGKATLLTFIFTRCPVPEYCPTMALRFAQLQKAIGASPDLAGHVQLLSITLDPKFDQPAVLKAYSRAVGANPAVWRFVTGDEAEIAALTKSFAVYTERNGVTLNHTLCTALIGPDGRILQLWRGNGWKIDEVLAAFSAAIHE